MLHSLWIPAFRLKQDAVPGRVITGWFKPTKTGTFDIPCAEMCGIGHGIMRVSSSSSRQQTTNSGCSNVHQAHEGASSDQWA